MVTNRGFAGENQPMNAFRLTRILIPCLMIASAMMACGTMQDGKPNLGVINRPSVSGDPCRNADWFEVGRVDGLSGIPAEASTYVGRCLSLGVAIDEELYAGGWQRGLVDYCTPDRAFDAGRSGESYSGVCPKNLETAFLKRFKLGTEIANLEKKNILIETEVDRKLSEISILDQALAKSRQAALEAEIQKLRDTIARNENTIRELEGTSSL